MSQLVLYGAISQPLRSVSILSIINICEAEFTASSDTRYLTSC